ncbi:MAG: tetratricopeptide repeat protein [Pirellulales bacterium]
MAKGLSALVAVALLTYFALALAQPDRDTRKPADEKHRQAMIRPQDIKWGPAPAKLPPGSKRAVLDGDPSKPGALYTFRVKAPDGYSVPPHTHPTDEHLTVIQGTILMGMGEKFDRAKLRELPAGSYIRLPKGEPHYNLYKGETVVQLHGIGPYDIHYVNPADDPTKTGRNELESRAHLFQGLGDHHRPITTLSKPAQRYFDQGLVFAFAFNHDEAIRSFEEAARLDPNAAMPWWGVALCNGPHINNPVMPPQRSASAWVALEKAMQRKQQATVAERALIEALSRRYANPPPDDRKPLDEAYATAMHGVWKANQADPDIGTLYAEALMDLQPWDLWNKDGSPKGNSKEIIAVLEQAMRLNPKHPGALHLYIHAMESSSQPRRAITAADRLRSLVPASGHLRHMPSHIDVLTGRWNEAVEANVRAIEADRQYRQRSPRQEFMHVYMSHNHQMLAFAAMMQGRSKMALDAARQIRPNVPDDYARRETVAIEPFFPILYDVLVRFGMWDAILREPAPPDYLPITTAMWKFSRAVAFAAKGQVAEAEKAHAQFKLAKAEIPPDRMVAVNPAERVLQIADHVIAGEIAYRKGNIDEAVNQLRRAIAIEADLVYMEPPEWTIPVRHSLGAILVDAERYEEAAAVYRSDLAQWPENGWSLFGLARCLRAQGNTAEAEQYEKRFEKAWVNADTKIGSSCLCVRAKP